jgi:REP element-mobilizing transposase RayT
MARARAILQSDFPYNISARCINREWFNLPMNKVWDIFCSELSDVCEKHQLKIHSFVLMSNHFHLIATTPKANISHCMQHFMGRTSRRLARAGNRINETFAGRHYKCVLQHPNYYLNAYKYNYRNPVTASICQNVESYPFSTLQFTTGQSIPHIPLAEDTTYISDPIGTLAWLNQTPERSKLEAVQNSMRHSYFKSRIDKKSGLPIIQENDLL